jgi:hypothetical protein
VRWLASLLIGCGRIAFDPTTTASGDGGAGDGAPIDVTLVPCGGTSHLLLDDFEDGVFDPGLWGNAFVTGATAYAEIGGRFVVTVPAGENGFSGYETTNAYDLEDDRIFVEVAEAPPFGSAIAIFQVFGTTGTSLGLAFEYDRGDLIVRRRNMGMLTVLATTLYNPIAHRWWQIREKAGTVYFETSPDGAGWVQFHQMPRPFPLGAAYFNLSAGANSSGADASARFDNVNGGGMPPLCF